MRISGFTIDLVDQRASINFIEKSDDVFAGSSGIVSVPIKTQAGETIEEAKLHSRTRAAEVLERVAKSLREPEIS